MNIPILQSVYKNYYVDHEKRYYYFRYGNIDDEDYIASYVESISKHFDDVFYSLPQILKLFEEKQFEKRIIIKDVDHFDLTNIEKAYYEFKKKSQIFKVCIHGYYYFDTPIYSGLTNLDIVSDYTDDVYDIHGIVPRRRTPGDMTVYSMINKMR